MSLQVVADGVLVAVSRRLATTTTLVVGSTGPAGRAGLLVDPAWEPDELAALARQARDDGVDVVAGFATHAHHDHVLWHPALGDVPRWASATAAGVAQRERTRLLAEARLDAARYGGADHTPEVLALLGRVRPLPAGERQVPDADGALPVVEVVEHAAHAPGHAALWLPGPRVLLAGDLLSDVEVPLPFDEITGAGDLAGYRAGLERLAPYVARAAVLVPGHGTPTRRPADRLDADLRYLDAVAAGRAPADPRLADPDVAAEHARTVRRVRAGR
ncbi:MBL fold metallo-hydrolase [Isoptericola jiangsuensis]|uniref:MBL fold metallo-hydrolase n=1 Tax=Isoptericola jiangsuensis TaxID=548579 RepID=UPI000BFAACF2|nr:MBL fold metallo-hydrolase [Isoptericola jiangsuensis]